MKTSKPLILFCSFNTHCMLPYTLFSTLLLSFKLVRMNCGKTSIAIKLKKMSKEVAKKEH